MHVEHTFSPIFNQQSRVLILGSFPSVISRENNFYYGNIHNRFWRLIAHLTNSSIPHSIHEKITLLLDNKISLWDIIQSCDIEGSNDGTIKNVVPTDLSLILNSCSIEIIITNGQKAYSLLKRFYNLNDYKVVCLPSTSSANAQYNFEKLSHTWEMVMAPFIR